MAVVMVPMYLIPAIAAGPQYIAQFSGGINYLMYAFMQVHSVCRRGLCPL
jgi:PTS system ascorbate-specific IIC component